MTSEFVCETKIGSLTFMMKPTEVKNFTELPNWVLGVTNADEVKQFKLYVNIRLKRFDGADGLPPFLTEVSNYLEEQFKTPSFIEVFGNLRFTENSDLDPLIVDRMPTTWGAKAFFHYDLMNFFKRRGREPVSMIGARTGSAQLNLIRLGLPQDTLFETRDPKMSYQCRGGDIVGEVTVFGKSQYFILKHSLLPLSKLMERERAMKLVGVSVRAKFPFMKGPATFCNWKFHE